MRAGLIAEKIGALTFKNVITADNIEAGVEITLPGSAKLSQGVLDGALIVGFSENYGGDTLFENTKGVVTGQMDSFNYKDIKFRNFTSELTTVAAIGSCSHCDLSLDAEGLANTHTFTGISFDNVTQKLKYGSSYKDLILNNPDGSIIGDGKAVYITGW